MKRQIRYITFKNHEVSTQKYVLLPVLEKADCIVDSTIIDKALKVSFDAKKLKAYGKKMEEIFKAQIQKMKQMNAKSWDDILSDDDDRDFILANEYVGFIMEDSKASRSKYLA